MVVAIDRRSVTITRSAEADDRDEVWRVAGHLALPADVVVDGLTFVLTLADGPRVLAQVEAWGRTEDAVAGGAPFAIEERLPRALAAAATEIRLHARVTVRRTTPDATLAIADIPRLREVSSARPPAVVDLGGARLAAIPNQDNLDDLEVVFTGRVPAGDLQWTTVAVLSSVVDARGVPVAADENQTDLHGQAPWDFRVHWWRLALPLWTVGSSLRLALRLEAKVRTEPLGWSLSDVPLHEG